MDPNARTGYSGPTTFTAGTYVQALPPGTARPTSPHQGDQIVDETDQLWIWHDGKWLRAYVVPGLFDLLQQGSVPTNPPAAKITHDPEWSKPERGSRG